MTENLIYTLPKETHNENSIKKILTENPQIKFVSLVGIDLSGNDTDEKIPVSLFLEDIDSFLNGVAVQTDGSSVVLPNIATLNNAKVDMIADLDCNWFVDYNYDNIDANSNKPIGTLRIPCFLYHNNKPVDSRFILKSSVETFQKNLLEEFNKNKFDLIIIDIMMPEMDGLTLCKNIRLKSSVPIIILSARNEEVDKVEGLNIGADDYMTKPFRIRELISRIKAVLRRKSNNNEDNKKVLKIGNISIHTLEARVFKNNEEIFLTSVEYKLLLILIQNKNAVLSRSQILEKLWDVSYDFVNDNTLTVYIKRLREKIEDDSSNPKKIITVRGFGYKWVGCENDVC